MFLLENIHRLDSSNLTTYACQTLYDLESENENNGTMNPAFDCEPGKLGKYCNMSCNNVLGNEFEYCEKHRICQGSQCGCAWGHQGFLCQQSKVDKFIHEWRNKIINHVAGCEHGS
jgi:hypothetical protein